MCLYNDFGFLKLHFLTLRFRSTPVNVQKYTCVLINGSKTAFCIGNFATLVYYGHINQEENIINMGLNLPKVVLII